MTDYKDSQDQECVHKFVQSKLSCGKSLIELTTYRGIPLWWFVDFDFRRYFINELTSKIPNRSAYYNRILSEFWFLSHSYIEILFDVTSKMLIQLTTKLHGGKKIKDNGNKLSKILFTAQDVEWKIVRDYESNTLKKSDAFFDSIIKNLANRYVLVGVYPLGPSISSLRIFMDKLKNWYVVHKPFNLYWSWDAWKNERESTERFKGNLTLLKNDITFKEICDTNNLYSEIMGRLKTYFYISFPRAVKNIEMAKRMIEEENPDLILIQNEYGGFEQALVIAAKFKNVPTVAIQHGIITPTHYGYIFNKEDKGKKFLPDITCVFGQYHYDLLTKNSIYEPEEVVITGEPRYDILYYADRIYDKKKFLENYNINSNHKILLWTTQCHGISDEENVKNFKAVFKTMQNLNGVTLVIKQHPGEGARYKKMIEDYLNRYNLRGDVVITPKDSDTYEQLFVCDLMITKNSTTAMEAIALNKPVIVLNLGEEPDVVDYVENGVALGVYKEDDLEPAINRLLHGDSDLVKTRERFIREYLYEIDGKATERVVSLIDEIIDKSRKTE